METFIREKPLHSIKFLKRVKNFSRTIKISRFFIYNAWTVPHGLWGIPDEDPFWQKYKDKPWNAGQVKKTDARVYAAMVEMLDAQMGKIMEMLKEYGIDDNTLVFFAGDNGGAYYFHTDKATGKKNWPRGFFAPNDDPKSDSYFRGQKTDVYEGGLRIPMVVRWPGVIKPNRVSDFLWYFPDVMTTLADLADVKPPSGMDGISILPELMGEELAGAKQVEHEYLYWRYNGNEAVRMGDWKLVLPKGGSTELYDLNKDISETTKCSRRQYICGNQDEGICRGGKTVTRVAR